MRTNFLPFSCGARNDIYLQRSSKALPTTDTLNQKEEEFIAGVGGKFKLFGLAAAGLAVVDAGATKENQQLSQDPLSMCCGCRGGVLNVSACVSICVPLACLFVVLQQMCTRCLLPPTTRC